MIIRYLGHSFFMMELENGMNIVCDPYTGLYNYQERKVKADVALVSHHHFDHDGVAALDGDFTVIDTEGTKKLADGVKVIGVKTYHDDAQGAKRGMNIVHVLEAEEMRIAHMGDLGHVPSREQLRAIGQVDILMIPVGGFYTIDAATAAQVCDLIDPTVIIPMHYKTEYDEEMPIARLNEFLKIMKADDTQLPFARVTRKDLSERPRVLTLGIAE